MIFFYWVLILIGAGVAGFFFRMFLGRWLD